MEWPGGVRQATEPLKDGDSRWVGDWVDGAVAKRAWDVYRVVWHLEQASEERSGWVDREALQEPDEDEPDQRGVWRNRVR